MEALLGGEENLCAQEGLESTVLQQVHQQQAITALKTAVPASTAVKTAIKTAANTSAVRQALDGAQNLSTPQEPTPSLVMDGSTSLKLSLQ